MISSSYTLAAAACSIVVSIIGLPVGRRGCILIGDTLVVIGGILQATSWSIAQLFVGRIACVSGL